MNTPVQVLGNAKGQFIIEAILLMVVFLSVLAAVISFFNSNEILAQLVQKPWVSLSGMIEDGEWMAPTAAEPFHPSQHSRHVTIDGVNPYGSAGGINVP